MSYFHLLHQKKVAVTSLVLSFDVGGEKVKTVTVTCFHFEVRGPGGGGFWVTACSVLYVLSETMSSWTVSSVHVCERPM